MNFHEKLCNTTQSIAISRSVPGSYGRNFFPPVCSSEEQQHLHSYWSNDWCTEMRGGMLCINMKYASGRAIVMQHCHEMVRKMQVNAIRSLLQFHWSDLVKCNPSVCFSKYGNKTSRKFIGVSSTSSISLAFHLLLRQMKRNEIRNWKVHNFHFSYFKEYLLLFHLFFLEKKKTPRVPSPVCTL